MTEAIIDILDRNQDKFIGINEANLHSAEEINRLIIAHKKAVCEALLDELANGFLANASKVGYNDSAVFQAIGETIKKYPIDNFIKTYPEQ